jgi:hypothetical protein
LCSAAVLIQAIGETNILMEIDLDDWLNNLNEESSTMREHLLSTSIDAMEDVVEHFIFNGAINRKQYYSELQEQNHPIVSSNIDVGYLASYFQINKKTMEKIIQNYKKEQIAIKKSKK